MKNSESMNYGIGSVARLTGLTTHTIRAWENRHDAIEAIRDSAGRRRYTQGDVERLTLLKRLVDLGERIGQLAGLSPQMLDQKLATLQAREPAEAAAGVSTQIAIYGAAAERLGKGLRAQPGDYVVVHVQSSIGPLAELDTAAEIDCLVLDLASVAPADAIDVETLGKTRRIVLIYGFARESDLRRLARAGVATVAAPASLADIRRAIDAAMPPEAFMAARGAGGPASSAAARTRFTETELDRLASVSTDIECECPHHLVSLVRYLRAFEKYSADCENRNEADATLHAFLHDETCRATQIIEHALQHLIEFEGINISDA